MPGGRAADRGLRVTAPAPRRTARPGPRGRAPGRRRGCARAGEREVDARRCHHVGAALDQPVPEQPAQGLAEHLGADPTDRRPQLDPAARAGAERREHHGVPGGEEQIGRRAQPAVRDQLVALPHGAILPARSAPSVCIGLPTVPACTSGSWERGRWLRRSHTAGAAPGTTSRSAAGPRPRPGRSPRRSPGAPEPPRDVGQDEDAVLLAVAWTGVEEALRAAGPGRRAARYAADRSRRSRGARRRDRPGGDVSGGAGRRARDRGPRVKAFHRPPPRSGRSGGRRSGQRIQQRSRQHRRTSSRRSSRCAATTRPRCASSVNWCGTPAASPRCWGR
ncbi:hypothetical protein SAMN05443637_101229 [Pseudonocardia thermophila]|uniref:Uncharacterized protein n=1 Tax=Pseudonocardia thermophila TaxID=1848 RepID=A0A1M6NG13_PSETH|nr:hypothetical protein SAMN05443637_101229 [Pseudonocardia thermophila]